jgi:hypothetical protein
MALAMPSPVAILVLAKPFNRITRTSSIGIANQRTHSHYKYQDSAECVTLQKHSAMVDEHLHKHSEFGPETEVHGKGGGLRGSGIKSPKKGTQLYFRHRSAPLPGGDPAIEDNRAKIERWYDWPKALERDMRL